MNAEKKPPVVLFAQCDALFARFGGLIRADREGLPLETSARPWSGGEVVHPGFGVLADDPDLARIEREAGVSFVRPRLRDLKTLQDRTAVFRIVQGLGIPHRLLTETPMAGRHELASRLRLGELSLPLLLKPVFRTPARDWLRIETEAEFAEEDSRLVRWQDEARLWGGGDGEFLAAYPLDESRLFAFPFGRSSQGSRASCEWFQPYDASLRVSGVAVLSRKAEEADLEPLVAERIRAWISRFCEAVGYLGVGTAFFQVDAGRAWWFDLLPRVETDFIQLAAGSDVSRILSLQFEPLGIRVEVGLEEQAPRRWVASLRSWNPVTETPRSALETAQSPGFLEPTRWIAADTLDELSRRLETAHDAPVVQYLRDLISHPRVKAGYYDAGFLESEFVPSKVAMRQPRQPAESPAVLALESGVVHSLRVQTGAKLPPRVNLLNVRAGGMLVPHRVGRSITVVQWCVGPGDRVAQGQKLAEISIVNPASEGGN